MWWNFMQVQRSNRGVLELPCTAIRPCIKTELSPWRNTSYGKNKFIAGYLLHNHPSLCLHKCAMAGSKSEELWVNEETLPSASDKLIKKSMETPFVPIGTLTSLNYMNSLITFDIIWYSNLKNYLNTGLQGLWYIDAQYSWMMMQSAIGWHHHWSTNLKGLAIPFSL